MEPARAIRTTRQRAGLTQAALAARAGTSQATLSAYENGRKQPSVETLARVLAAAGARLAVEPAPAPVVQPTAAERRRAARELTAALELADALPKRPARVLRFPRLDAPARRAA
jgi:transcriptional regulator with XRE-family HTH domain